MIKIELLEEKTDIETILEPKKRIFNLVNEVNGSMLNFHKLAKRSEDIEELANSFFDTKKNIQKIKIESSLVSMERMRYGIEKVKPIKCTNLDFI
jgi:hypothetical protein